MTFVALGEIFVVLFIRPIRFLCGGQRTALGRALWRFEHWLLRHLHVMGAESRMRYELEMHGQATGFLAEGLTDQTSAMPTTSDTIQRVRDETGATLEASARSSQLRETPELKRGQRQVESRGGDRSDDIQEAMLQAQRRQNQLAGRARRRPRQR